MELFLFIICQDNVIQMPIDLTKENRFKLKKVETHEVYPVFLKNMKYGKILH